MSANDLGLVDYDDDNDKRKSVQQVYYVFNPSHMTDHITG